MSTYNDGQIDASLREQSLIQKRAQLRSELRAEFTKQALNPYRHMKGEGNYGGYLFDPAMQRWMSMRANQYDYFKPTPKTLVMPAVVFGSIILLTWFVHTRRSYRENLYRTGQIAYKDRKNKFI